MTSKEIGKKGESLAVDYLLRSGYIILEQNWRFSRAEIDVIARAGSQLIFVEVKSRSYNYYGPPDQFISVKQKNLIMDAAGVYMSQIGYSWAFRFDVISILLHKNESYKLDHFEDAFFSSI